MQYCKQASKQGKQHTYKFRSCLGTNTKNIHNGMIAYLRNNTCTCDCGHFILCANQLCFGYNEQGRC